MKTPIPRIIFAPLGRERAFGTQAARTIHVDPRGANIGHTLLHELQHLAHPDWSETRVRRETARLWRAMGWQDKARLYQALGKGRLA